MQVFKFYAMVKKENKLESKMKPQARILSDEEIVQVLTDPQGFEQASAREKTFIALRLREFPDLLHQVHDVSFVLVMLILKNSEQEAKKSNQFYLRIRKYWNETLGGEREPLWALFFLFCLIILWAILLGVFVLLLKSVGSFFLWLLSTF